MTRSSRQSSAPAKREPRGCSSSRRGFVFLDTQDRDALRALMDKAAADVVTFRCAVQVQVREAKDYPFVAALLDHLETHAEIERGPDGATILSP